MNQWAKTRKLHKFGITAVLAAVFVVVFSGFYANLPDQEDEPVMIEGTMDLSDWNALEDKNVRLSGEWELYWQQLLTPEDLREMANDLNPQYVHLPFVWNNQYSDSLGYRVQAKSYATFRTVIKTEASEVGMKIPIMLTASKVWVNGKLLVSSGEPGPDYDTYTPIEQAHVIEVTDIDGELDILIQVANHHISTGGISEVIELGDYQQLNRQDVLGMFVDALMAGVLLFMCIYHLMQYYINREERSPLYFALFCMGFVMRTTVSGHKIIQWAIPDISWIAIVRMAYLTFVPIIFFTWFIHNVFKDESNRPFVRGTTLAWILYTILVLSFPQPWASFVMYVGEAMVLIMCSHLLIVLYKAQKKGRKDVRPIIIGTIVMLVTILNDILFSLKILTTVELAIEGTVVFLLSQSYVISSRFNRALRSSVYYSRKADRMNEALRGLNRDLEQKVVERTRDVRKLLDNAGQGFLSFGDDYLINKDTSEECRQIFGREVGGDHILSVLQAALDQRTYEIMASAFTKVLSVKDPYTQSLLLSLVPDEVIIDGKHYRFESKIISKEGSVDVMMILTDMTDQKFLEQARMEERQNLRLIVYAVTNSTDVRREIDGFEKEFLYGFRCQLESGRSPDLVMADLYRVLHTYKGTFAQYCMFRTEKAIHNLENIIYGDRAERELETLSSALEIMDKIHPIRMVAEDKAVITDVLGPKYFDEGDEVTVSVGDLLMIEAQISSLISGQEALALIDDLRRLRYVSLRDQLLGYDDYLQQLSAGLGKKLEPLSVVGKDLLIDQKRFGNMMKSLIHIFKNSLDHGIELPEIREENGKSPKGRIECQIGSDEKEGLLLTIRNDGDALDPDLFESIFEDHMTSKNEASVISGRGVGLPAVKKETEQMKGSVRVRNHGESGVVFELRLPYQEGMAW